MYSEGNQKSYLKELNNLREYCEEQSAKLDLYCNELELLKKDLNSIAEINQKTKEFLILELESNMDKQNQNQIKQENKLNSFQNFINSLENENKNKELKIITHLTENIGRLKQIIDEKDELLSKFEKENVELNQIVLNDNEKIK